MIDKPSDGFAKAMMVLFCIWMRVISNSISKGKQRRRKNNKTWLYDSFGWLSLNFSESASEYSSRSANNLINAVRLQLIYISLFLFIFFLLCALFVSIAITILILTHDMRSIDYRKNYLFIFVVVERFAKKNAIISPFTTLLATISATYDVRYAIRT